MQRSHSVSSVSSGAKRGRGGFTLLELLIVIALIAVLVGLLFAALGGASTTARVTEVVAEINNLEKAIQEFKLQYGVDVPSSIRLHEVGAHWSGSDVQTRRSKALLTRIWPDFAFGDVDFNGDGAQDDTIELFGSECLVFFLGGVCVTQDSSGNYIVGPDGSVSGPGTPARWTPVGFSANPANPFARGGSRVGPFYEFDISRLVNVVNTGNSMPEYLDPIEGQSMPYAYASTARGAYAPNSGAVYRPEDLNWNGSGPFTSVYHRPNNGQVYNPRGFQIISPGFDGEFGIGGEWEPGSPLLEPRTPERDNITNFSGGMLGG